MIVIIALCVVVLFETGLLLLLVRGFGQMKQQGAFTRKPASSSGEWGLAIGDKAPSFIATDYEERPIRLDDFQGQRRILVFILPGCSSCADTIKVLNTILSDEPNLTVLVVGSSNRDQNRAYATEHDARMPILTFASGFDSELYHIQGAPFAFVIDEAGIIRAKGILHAHEQLQRLLGKAFASVPVSR
jgi:peroxiredoxin